MPRRKGSLCLTMRRLVQIMTSDPELLMLRIPKYFVTDMYIECLTE